MALFFRSDEEIKQRATLTFALLGVEEHRFMVRDAEKASICSVFSVVDGYGAELF